MSAQITAKIIAHSVSNMGSELISVEAVAPYFLDAEIEKHGMLSSNSSSNRAIPFSKMKDAEFFIPSDVRINQPGMQGFEVLTPMAQQEFEETLVHLRDIVVEDLEDLSDKFSVHKQHLNRYLAPWSMQKKIMTGTRETWNGIFELRDHKAADPAVQEWAKRIKTAISNSMAVTLKNDEWHLPYITAEESYIPIEGKLKLSAARCARTSYRLHDGTATTVNKDLELFAMLADSTPPHLTPLTHQGKPAVEPWERGVTHMMKGGVWASGNFHNWVQFRHWY